MEQYLYFPPITGIANRIKKLFSALRFKVDLNEPLTLYWQYGKYMNHGFGELFRCDLFSAQEKQCDGSELPEGCLDVSMGDDWRLCVAEGELPQGFTQAYPKDDPLKEYIDFEYERIPSSIREAYLPYFQALRPTPVVEKRICDVKLPTHYVGVHIRINEEWISIRRGTKNDLQRFITEMQKEPDDTIFFLASQSERVSQHIKETFGTRIADLPDKDYFDTIDAAADLYLLSKAKKLIGTYGSTFSEVSWWLSDCKQEIRIIGTYREWHKEK